MRVEASISKPLNGLQGGLKRKRRLVALPLLSNRCIVILNVLWLFLEVPRVGLQCVILCFLIILTYFQVKYRL